MKNTLFIIALVFLCTSAEIQAGERNLLSQSSSEEALLNQLLPGTSWVDFPAYADREAWMQIPETYRLSLIQKGEEAIGFDWNIVKATDYLEFVRSGSRNIMQNPMFSNQHSLEDLVMAELMEGKGRFLDEITNGIWVLSEQSSWVLSAHLYLQEAQYGLPDMEEQTIDLFAAEISSLFSWTHFFLKEELDKINPLISRRIELEIQHRILDVYYARDDFWWMSFGDSHVNNWNPWVNHNILTTMMLMEEDAAVRAKYVYKTMRSVDQFIDFYEDDGGCDEGPSYWGHAGGAMFEYLELLGNVTGGSIDIFDQEIIGNIGKYIYRANVSYPYVINFADASSRGGGRPGIVYRYGERIKDPFMQSHGAFLAEKANWKQKVPGGNLEAKLANLFTIEEITSAEAKQSLVHDFYLPDLQICGARDTEGSSDGFFFAAKAGHNAENHNHNDVGNFILYYNGKPALIDVGVGTYTRQTFSDERYSIWTMQSQYHNTPTINGMQQLPGDTYSAKDVHFNKKGSEVTFQSDISGAYPAEAMIQSWNRSLRFKRGKSFRVSDSFSLKEKTGETSWNLMTSLKPEEMSDGSIVLHGDGFELKLRASSKALALKIEPISIKDSKLRKNWGDLVYRLVYTSTEHTLNDCVEFTITEN